jgi:branched-chain amino acid transport system permease protein
MSGIIAQSVFDGIMLGGVYGLVAIGLTLIFGVMRIVNFSHGALMMLGMYVSYWLFALFGLSPYLSIPVSALVMFLVGAGIQRFIMERSLHAPEQNQLLITLGIMLFLQNFALLFFHGDFRSVRLPELETVMRWGPLDINKERFIAFVVAVVLSLVFYQFLKKTYLGKAIRGTSQQPEGAMAVGVNTKKINSITFGLGSACAAVAGALILPFFYVSPDVGDVFLLKTFVIVVLGGLGNFVGALLGGMIVGIAESLGGLLLPGSLQEMFIYILFVLVLLFKPNGLLGRE